jgi:Zeta toxin
VTDEVPQAQSRLGILDRYDARVRTAGHGRLTLRDNHDAAYTGVLSTAEAIDRQRLADAVSVYRRGDVLLYTNDLTEHGDWRWPPAWPHHCSSPMSNWVARLAQPSRSEATISPSQPGRRWNHLTEPMRRSRKRSSANRTRTVPRYRTGPPNT